MSMDQAPENNLPPHTDAAHRDPAAGTGLRLGGDWARERDALRRQVQECEDHNSELQAVLVRVRAACETGMTAARNRIAQGGDVARWATKREVYAEIYEIVKPAE